MDGLELTAGWGLQVQLVSKLLVVWGVRTTERQHKNLGQNLFLGTPLFQTSVLQVTVPRKEPGLFLLTCGTEKPALQA